MQISIQPHGIEFINNVYVADYVNNSIRKITPSGEVSIFAGNSNRSPDIISTNFNLPIDIEQDLLGNL